MTGIPRIGITLGDPAGIGPEIVVKALSRSSQLPRAAYVIFGSGRVLEDEQKAQGLSLSLRPFPLEASALPAGLYLDDLAYPQSETDKGRPSADSGKTSFLFFQKAVEEAEKKNVEAIVTAPISKQAWGMAGLRWRGHTEYLSRSYPEAIMAFWSEPLKVALLSHHVPLREALLLVTEANLEKFFWALSRSLDRAASRPFHVLVSGLNPHAGEGGLIGREEEEIEKAVRKVKAAGLPFDGPFPPDTVFRKALGQKDVLVAALHHDQGLIPFKLVAFETGVNVTLGLPFVRTSPDHGTAFDIAPLRKADPGSFIQAIRLAAELSA